MAVDWNWKGTLRDLDCDAERRRENGRRLSAPVRWFMVLSLGIIPGLTLVALIESRHKWIRTMGWVVAIGAAAGGLLLAAIVADALP